jgi:E3 ubiquitin-protein ligase SHPRH
MQDTIFEKARVSARWEIRFDQTLEHVFRLSLNDRLRLVDYIFPKPSKAITADDFYAHIGTIPKDFIDDPNKDHPLQHPDVACQLYPFQKRAVCWMLQREGVIQARPSRASDMQAQLSPMCEVVKDLDGNDLYMSRHQGILSTDESWFKTNFPIQFIRGGILAEVLVLFNFLTSFRRWASVKRSR